MLNKEQFKMKKIMLLMVAIFVLVLSNQVFAANWQFVEQVQHPQCGAVSFYIDPQTVVKNGDTMTFDTQYVFSSPCNGETRKVNKEEVNLSSRQRRYIETVGYDANGAQVNRDVMSPWYQIVPNSPLDNMINRALQYAQ
jgi:hypothetical protein